MEARKLTKRERTAYHEAGHAVANYDLGLAIKEISIIPDDDSLGRVKGSTFNDFNPEIDTDSRTRYRAEKMIISNLSGYLAERMFAPKGSRIGAGQDFGMAIDLAMSQCGSTRETNAYVKWLEIRAEQILKMPLNKYSIEVLAHKLLEKERLNGRKAREIIRNAMLEYIRFHQQGLINRE